MPRLIKFIALIISLSIFTQCDYINAIAKKKNSGTDDSAEEKKFLDTIKYDTVEGKNNADSIQKLYEKDLSRIFGPPSNEMYISRGYTFKGNAKWKINKKTTLKMEIYCKDFEDLEPTIKYCAIINSQNRSRKDSTVHNDGTWELMEWYYEGENISKIVYTSSGRSKITSMYDSLERILSKVHIGKKRDTITSERYVWGDNGRLMQIITKGDDIQTLGFVTGGPAEPPPKGKSKIKPPPKYVVRNFIYGTPCDSVRVEPTDYGVYDKSFGKIPEESDGLYMLFKSNPYMFTRNALPEQKRRCEEYKEVQKKEEARNELLR
jgi:hypothetical protein